MGPAEMHFKCTRKIRAIPLQRIKIQVLLLVFCGLFLSLCRVSVLEVIATGDNFSDSKLACGVVDDASILAPKDYQSFVPPAAGGSWVDSYGCTVHRLSNSAKLPHEWVMHHEYSTWSPMNLDNTKLLTILSMGGYEVLDLSGKTLIDWSTLKLASTEEARWSRRAPNIIYAHHGTEFWQVDISNQKNPKFSVLHRFSEYASLGHPDEGDLSNDGDHFVFEGLNSDKSKDLFVYQISSGQKRHSLHFTGDYDNWKLLHDNRVIINWGAAGTGPHQGVELYTEDMKFIRKLTRAAQHGATAYDPGTRKEYWVYEQSGNDVDLNPCTQPGPTGVAKVDVDTGKQTCIFTSDWTLGGHVSSNNPYGWIAYDPTDSGAGTAVSNPALGPDWRTKWKPHFNEIVYFKIDGSVVYRVAHHRSRSAGNDACASYWSAPRVATNMDGSYLIFDSNMTHIGAPLAPCSRDYTDVFLIKVR